MPMWIFVVASFAGAMLGAVMQYLLGQRSERLRGVEMRRTEAYVNLIKAVAGLETSTGETGLPLQQIRALYAESRARIAIYGSTEVATRMVELLRSTHAMGPERAARLAVVVAAMRAEGLGTEGRLPEGFIEDLLFSKN